MATLPPTRVGKVEFYESRLADWADHAPTIGLTGDAVAQLAADTAAAREAHDAMLAARAAAMAATLRFHTAVATMHAGAGRGSDMLATIRAFAETTDDSGVYARAQIPPPRTRSTVPPPGTPTRFAADLRQDGSVELRWACDNPARSEGTMYEVRRAVGDGPMVFVGTVGKRKFLDRAIPAADLARALEQGRGRVLYEVTAIRSTSRGTPAQYGVQFGNGQRNTNAAPPRTAPEAAPRAATTPTHAAA